MAECGGTHNVDVGEYEVSGQESADEARKALRTELRVVVRRAKPCSGDCPGARKCTATWDPKDLDKIVSDATVKEYDDEDGDTAFKASTPKGTTLTVTCECVFKAKKKGPAKKGGKKTGKK
jgi:hypothetical protein